jgi:UDP-glucose 4-epimerase
MKTVLVIGCAGFLGSHLAQALIDRGDRVIGLDNLSYGCKGNLSSFLDAPAFTFVEGDVLDRELLMDLSKGAQTIVHFASYKIPREGGYIKTIEVNTKGTENVLEAARERGIRVIFGSTDDVYGKNTRLPFSEESALVIGNSRSIRWSDAISKVYSEQLCFAYQSAYQIPVNIVRFSIVYGPRQRKDWWGGPLGVFIERTLTGDAVPVHGDGLQVRNFVYVSDAVDGILKLIEREDIQGELLNIGSHDNIRILDLAYRVWRLVGRPGTPKIEFVAYPDLCKDYDDVQLKDLDLTKAACLLGYAPRVGIESGLRATIDWFRTSGN